MSKYIPNWSNMNLRCYFCGATNSVKYTMRILDPVISDKPTSVCACNKCAIFYMGSEITTREV